MSKMFELIAVGTFIVALGGCSASSSGGKAETPAVAIAPPPAGSPLSKVTVGMTKKQVKDVLGEPTDENSYPTGKLWIPWYFGNDARRVAWYYKGMGRVVFTDGNLYGGGAKVVLGVEYDPNESGDSGAR